MKLIGFNFTKISIEKLKPLVTTENLKASTEIDVPEIKKIEPVELKLKDELIEIKFSYKIKYEPEFANVELNGRLIISVDSKTAKEVIKQWANKTMLEDFRLFVFNVILRRSTLKALQLEEEIGLPLHMAMPSFKKEEKT